MNWFILFLSIYNLFYWDDSKEELYKSKYKMNWFIMFLSSRKNILLDGVERKDIIKNVK